MSGGHVFSSEDGKRLADIIFKHADQKKVASLIRDLTNISGRVEFINAIQSNVVMPIKNKHWWKKKTKTHYRDRYGNWHKKVKI